MAKARRKRKKYTDSQRNNILAAAKKEGLTAGDVKKRFGVTPVTYYSWRKKIGVAGRKTRMVLSRRAGVGSLTTDVRAEVRSKVRQVLPNIVRSEVSSYLNPRRASGGRRRRRQRA